MTIPSLTLPSLTDIDRIINAALAEDIGQGDITSNATLPRGAQCHFAIRAREACIVSGIEIAARLLMRTTPGESAPQIKINVTDGTHAQAGTTLLEGAGLASLIFRLERVALNLMQHMSGIATLTGRYVEAIAGTDVILLDTRKTTPGLRVLDKYAVRCGGAQNQRMRLDDAVLIKDNHIAVCGGVIKAIEKARAYVPASIRIEVECDTLDQVDEAVRAGADIIMLDNMDIPTMREAVKRVAGKVPLEASGNVTLERIRLIAETGVQYISVGRITHSAPSVDIGLDVIMN
ncbi:MAG: nicotinate-nucleotide pyrophosphorylase [Rickettsiales bacterium]|jgi:nicotinate-nucleotide pyrophosphorylase (carboxylating)|nr:nicotinate-nucleotide pyrophosphorylase [Rickettsiales bacterium]